jgi:hypothetical protein
MVSKFLDVLYDRKSLMMSKISAHKKSNELQRVGIARGRQLLWQRLPLDSMALTE